MAKDTFRRCLSLAAAATAFILFPSAVSAQNDSPPVEYYKAHGFLLWIAFGLLFPVGIIVAKYAQIGLPTSWFHLHWIIQSMGALAATAGVAIGLSKFNAVKDTTHAKLGLALMILVWMQLLGAIYRPARDAKVRRLWHFLHWLFGMTSVILGWYNIFRGLYLYEQDFTAISPGVYIAFAVEVAVLSFIYLFLGFWSETDELQEELGNKP